MITEMIDCPMRSWIKVRFSIWQWVIIYLILEEIEPGPPWRNRLARCTYRHKEMRRLWVRASPGAYVFRHESSQTLSNYLWVTSSSLLIGWESSAKNKFTQNYFLLREKRTVYSRDIQFRFRKTDEKAKTEKWELSAN